VRLSRLIFNLLNPKYEADWHKEVVHFQLYRPQSRVPARVAHRARKRDEYTGYSTSTWTG